MSRLSLCGAQEVLLPPEVGLPALRGAAVEAQSLRPGSVCVADGAIVALEDDDGADVRLDCSGCAIVPGFVDCHTHLPFAGWRADEYARKVAGEPYADIARGGGGIRRSVAQLAAADDAEVLDGASTIAAEMLRGGTTCIELKSGYGGGLDGERRHVRLAGELAARVAQRAVVTALVAHAVPDGYDADGWLALVAEHLDELLADGPVEALDCFVEDVAFANEHLEHVGELAARRGLRLRAHVDQLRAHGSVPVALAAGARSVDHLSCTGERELRVLAGAACAGVLLPGAELLNDERAADARTLVDHGGLLALATDLNPGTSPVQSIAVVVGLAVRRYRLSVREALAAVTLNAAWVLGRERETGSVEVGKRADLVVLDGPVEHLPYRFGRDPVLAVVLDGELRHLRADARDRLHQRCAA